MARQIAESTNHLSVFFLKEHKYLPQEKSCKYGGIKWTSGSWQNNINFIVATSGKEPETLENSYIELIYTTNARLQEEKLDMRYKIPLVTTSCNYGGKRYWFLCNLYKSRQYCGRRVGVIYSISKWFGCRYCAEVAYEAQFGSKGMRFGGSITESEVEKAYSDIKRHVYKGKLTRKYKRYLKLRKKMDNVWIMAGEKFGMKY
jgi:hypothetical protein